MKKIYSIIIIISFILIGIGTYFLIHLDFENRETEIDSGETIIHQENEYITLGEFLKMIVMESDKDIDYDLLAMNDNNDSPYLLIAEKYDVIEKGTITKEELANPFSRVVAARIIALCDINMCGNTLSNLENVEIIDIDNVGELDCLFIQHTLSKGFMNTTSYYAFQPSDFFTREDATTFIHSYAH